MSRDNVRLGSCGIFYFGNRPAVVRMSCSQFMKRGQGFCSGR